MTKEIMTVNTTELSQFAVSLVKAQADQYAQLKPNDHKDLNVWTFNREQDAWETHNCEQISEAFSHLDRKWRWPR